MAYTKTQTRILDEIAAKGYSVIQHGYNQSPKLGDVGTWGVRERKAIARLVQLGVIRIAACGTDRNAYRGKYCNASWIRVEAL